MLQSKENQKEEEFDENLETYKSYFGVANTKVYIEKMCKFYSNLGMKTTVIRHTNVYGPNDKFDLEKSHVLGATLRKVKTANDGDILDVWGSGKARRDFLYIDDLADFINKAYLYQKDRYELFNCGMGSSISINELVKLVIMISKKKITFRNDLSKPDIETALSLNCDKAFDLIGWRNNTSLEDGIIKTYSTLR